MADVDTEDSLKDPQESLKDSVKYLVELIRYIQLVFVSLGAPSSSCACANIQFACFVHLLVFGQACGLGLNSDD